MWIGRLVLLVARRDKVMGNITLDMGEFLHTGTLVGDYLAILESTIKSLSDKVDELQFALDQARIRIIQLERENQKLRDQMSI